MSSFSCFDYKGTIDRDSDFRKCEIFISSRQVPELGGDNPKYHHWFLIFKFIDEETVLRFVQLRSNQGKIDYDLFEPKQEVLKFKVVGTATGEFSFSPRKLQEIMKTHPMNGQKYCPVLANCHKYVIVLLNLLNREFFLYTDPVLAKLSAKELAEVVKLRVYRLVEYSSKAIKSVKDFS